MNEVRLGDDGVLVPGTTFEGRYQILSKLGEGGFGTVYKAQQLSTGQPVALKILRVPDGNDMRATRFLRETRMCAQLHHPNIVRLVDSGQTAGGSLYIAFAFAPGDTLAAVLEREGAMNPREARHLMLQVLDALACAHAASVVHRDLKPSNIMVIPTGARRNAVVLDFGIGAMVDAGRAPRLTRSGEGLGTPGYGAPEQWRGAEPSPRADLFSWGLVFLECLTGTPVYSGSSADIFYSLLGPEPVALPEAIVHHRLGVLLNGALEKDAVRRDATAQGLLIALDECDLRGLTREAILGADRSWSGRLTMLHRDAESTESLIHSGGGERRQLTALCCELAVEPGGAVDGDAELLDDPLRHALELCADLARRHGGHVAAVLGGQLLIYFGYPSAAEDDPRRAARAALAIIGRLRGPEDRAARVGISLGIHTGMVIDGDLANLGQAKLITGATPRRAAQLAASAAPWTISVTAASQRLLRDAFELVPEPSLPGATTGERFRLHNESLEAACPDSERRAAPMIGRDAELALLLERWRRAHDGIGQVSLISGEPGIGKSRLARALRDGLADAAQFLEVRCSPDSQNAALAALVEPIERVLGLDQVPEPGTRPVQLARALAHFGLDPEALMPVFLPLLGLPVAAPYRPLEVSSQRLKELTLDAIASLLLALTERRPLLLLVEDLHWADPTTMELLTQLVRTAPEAPLCVVMTARPEFAPTFPTAGMLLLPLARLERSDIEGLLATLARGKALPGAVIDQVIARADGVPLFIEELIRMMIDAGMLLERDHDYELVGPLTASAIPGTLRALLTARLDRLARARNTAQLAAALGREFQLDVLAAASAERPEVLADDLERLIAVGMIQRKRRGKDVVGVFKHALIRDAAYESMSPTGRCRVHARIAQALERGFPALVAARPDLLAHHHAAAKQFDRAVSFGLRATRLAAEQSQSAEAIAHAQLARDHIAHRPAPERASLELSLNGIVTPVLMQRYGHGNERVKAMVDHSQQLLDEIGDSDHRFSTLCALTYHHHVGGDRRRARDTARQLFELANSGDDTGRRVIAYTLLGQCRWIDGDYVEGENHLVNALELYDPIAHVDHAMMLGADTRVWASAALAQLRWFTGEIELARASIRDAIGWADQQGRITTRGMAHFYDALVCQYAGDKRGTGAAAGSALSLAERYGLRTQEVYCKILQFWACDDADSAAPILAEMDRIGCRLGLAYYAALPALTLMERGEFARALERLEDCVAMCVPMDEHYYEPELHVRIAMCKLQLSREHRAAARASLRRAQDMARAQGMCKTEIEALVEEARHFGWQRDIELRVAELAARRPHALDGERLAFARASRIAV